MNIRTLHRASAIVVGAFACLHLANHLASLVSIPSHLAFMEAARHVYRQPAVEPVLLACVAFQACSGLWLVVRGWRRRVGFVAWLQASAGMYLALFLLIHLGAVFYGRTVLRLDTNFYYAAAGLHVPPNPYFFAPYYFLAVLALFTHLGCAAWWGLRLASARAKVATLALCMSAGGALSLALVLSLAGQLRPFDVPAQYKATYARQGG